LLSRIVTAALVCPGLTLFWAQTDDTSVKKDTSSKIAAGIVLGLQNISSLHIKTPKG
jgi:hypothetical protein